jgi:uncharacterized membrane protein YhaH (DUF805 family)
MVLPLKRYAEFEGRSRRKEYWMFVLLQLGIAAVAAAIGGLLASVMGEAGGMAVLLLVVLALLGLIVPSIAVTVRRLHDQDKSGWFYLLTFVPYIGGIIMIVLMCIEGTRGPNKYGADPKNPEELEAVFG